MATYLPSDWKPSDETVRKLQDMGYTKDYLRSQWVAWKQRQVAFQQKKDYRGLANDWDYRFLRDMIETDPARAEVPQKNARPQVHNPAADPEYNKSLSDKFKEIESIPTDNAKEKLEKLRQIANGQTTFNGNS